jgi:hypothetical protein
MEWWSSEISVRVNLFPTGKQSTTGYRKEVSTAALDSHIAGKKEASCLPLPCVYAPMSLGLGDAFSSGPKFVWRSSMHLRDISSRIYRSGAPVENEVPENAEIDGPEKLTLADFSLLTCPRGDSP